jgi:adenylate cyclase
MAESVHSGLYAGERSIKRNKVIAIVIVWAFIGVLITIYDHFFVHSILSSGPSSDYSFLSSLILNVGIGVAAALLGATFIVYVVHEKFRNKPYWQSIALVAGSFIVLSITLTALVSAIMLLLTNDSTPSWEALKLFIADSSNLKNILVWLVVVALTQVTLQVHDKFGQGVLWSLIVGKYQVPKEELRIFMFVDLNASTQIAEKLGNDLYHRFLRDFYADITNPIIYNRGEIYQYVGDEVVISWKPLGKGFDNSCLHCYFEMLKVMAERNDYYMTTYKYAPSFKVGLHHGHVIAGEIGIIKRDVTFSGDVLNTASRIQGKCKEYGVTILVSNALLDLLPESDLIQRIPIGNVELRGREHSILLSTLKPVNRLD